MGGRTTGLDARDGPAARLARVRGRLADLKARREAFERGVEERRAMLEEEASVLEREESEAKAALLAQRRAVLRKMRPLLESGGTSPAALDGIEEDEERWRELLASLGGRREEGRPLTSAEEIRRLLP
jgi:hypothetical protein